MSIPADSITNPAPRYVRYLTDDEGVDRLAKAMKRKLRKKKREGRGGWNDPDDCSAMYLADLLADELTSDDPDPVDIANYAMMLYNRGRPGRRALRAVSRVLCEAMEVD